MIALLLGWLAAALAHPLAPSGLELDLAEGVQVTWRTPATRPEGVVLRPVLPARCAPTAAPLVEEDVENGTLVARQPWDCGAAGLVGDTVRVEGLASAPVDVVVTVRHAGGATERTLLHGENDHWTVPPPREAPVPFPAFLRLGVDHLVTGWDHVLFVLGLLLLVGPTRRLVTAVTAFTVGHSLTLGLATLGVVRIPQAPVEVLIAVSIVWLALEILGDVDRPGQGWLARHPGALCAAIGLVHGLGFAGALASTGLPTDAVLPALLGFNLGVEVGQLSVIGAALLAWTVVGRLERARIGRAVPAWALGVLAATWVWERALGALWG